MITSHWYSISILLALSIPCLGSEPTQVERLRTCARGCLSEDVFLALQKQATDSDTPAVLQSNQRPLLFEWFPALQKSISYLSLADLPTPISHCHLFGKRMGAPHLYLKNDGKTGKYRGRHRYQGGNKVRKLEFILADALAHGAEAVVTFGCAGSNHALTTSAYAHALGLDAYCMLMDQYNSPTVQKNLLLQLHYQAHLVYDRNRTDSYKSTTDLFLSQKEARGKFPYVIPVGGSIPLGVLGYINAVLELKKQIKEGLIEEPKVIFVGVGSGGTAAGILLGMQIAGLSSKLVAINISREGRPNAMRDLIHTLFDDTCTLLNSCDPHIPVYTFPEEQIEVLCDFAGDGYGRPTAEAQQLTQELLSDEDTQLDPTYSSKALAGTCSYIKEHNLHNDILLFWNTYCGEDYTHLTSSADYHSLPEAYQKYFEHT